MTSVHFLFRWFSLHQLLVENADIPEAGFKITVLPYDYDYSEDDFDGIFLSNGPGDPSKYTKTISILKKYIEKWN